MDMSLLTVMDKLTWTTLAKENKRQRHFLKLEAMRVYIDSRRRPVRCCQLYLHQLDTDRDLWK